MSLFYFKSQNEKEEIFKNNKDILQAKFDDVLINNKNDILNKKIAAYFVSDIDHNGAFLSTAAIMNHVNEVENLQKHGYEVYPYLISWKLEIDNTLISLGLKNQQADLLYINAHGYQDSIDIFNQVSNDSVIEMLNSHDDLQFKNLKANADIILNSCSTGKGFASSFAAKLANDNPGTRVFAATEKVFVADIKFTEDNQSISEIIYHKANQLDLPEFVEYNMEKFCFSGETNEFIG